jgi:transcriptional regulator with XRE-family HTH domain
MKESESDGFSRAIAKNVKRLRTAKRMTQKELSEKIGGSHSYCYFVEVLEKMPSLLMGLRIAKALGVRPEDLLKK